MKPQVKEAWVTALESEEFAQGSYRLQSQSKEFCCLGVLCEIYRRHHPETSRWVPTVGNDMRFEVLNFPGVDGYAHQGDSGLPPDAVKDWAELDFKQKLTIAGQTGGFVLHNDGAGTDIQKKTFKQIAAAIKEQL